MYTYGICQIDFSYISLPLNIANMKGYLNLSIILFVSVAVIFTYGQDNKQAKTGKICESFLPIFFIKSVFYSENRFSTFPDAKREIFIKQMAYSYLYLTWGIIFHGPFDNQMFYMVLSLLIMPLSLTELEQVKSLKSLFFINLSTDFFSNFGFKLVT